MEGRGAQEERAAEQARKMGDFVAAKEIQGLLGAMYSNVVVSRPADVLQFLVDSLDKPDARSAEEKEALLQETFGLVAKERASGDGAMSAAEAVVIVRESDAIVSRFPLHARAVGESLAATPEDWGAFRERALDALGRPAV